MEPSLVLIVTSALRKLEAGLLELYVHTYIHILSFFQFHTARLLAKYRTRQKHQSYTRAKQLLQVSSNPRITQSTPQPKYNTIFTLQHNILKEI